MAPLISVVVPTITGREESLHRCLTAYAATTHDYEVIVVANERACGIAWQKGAAVAQGRYLHLTADDLEPHSGWWLPLAEACESGRIGCPIVYEPDGSVQSVGGMGWEPCPRWKRDWQPVDWTTVPFVTRKQWESIAPMIPLHYCTDIWVSARARQAGIPTVVRAHSGFTHHNEPVGRGAGMDVHERNRHDREAFTRYLKEVQAA